MEKGKRLRRWERFSVSIRTKITFVLDGEVCCLFGEASDLSQGGLSLFIPRILEEGISLAMELSLPYQSKPMSIRGVIRNRDRFTYGIEFLRATAYQQHTIATLCKALQLLQ